MKRCIVIPAYNEEATIGDVLSVASACCESVIVVDDKSTDSTSLVVQNHHAKLVSNANNLGYEKSLTKGIRLAIKCGATSILTMDADGQHPANSIDDFFDKIEVQAYALAIGERQRLPRFSEKMLSIYSNYQWQIKDMCCGMKCYSADQLKKFEKLDCNYNSVGTYLASQLIKAGARYTTIPITENERIDESRFGNSLKAELAIMKALIQLLR